MKGFRKFFSGKPKNENKENIDVSRHVVFKEDNSHRHSERGSRRNNVYCNFSQRSFDDMNPAAAYHCPTKPRAYRPTKSCPGGQNSPGQASSSEDDQSTLIAKSERFVVTRTHQSKDDTHMNRKYIQKLDLKGMQTSEYGSGDPSPISDALRHPTDRYESFRYPDEELTRYKAKYRHYRNRVRCMQEELEKLRGISMDVAQLYKKVGALQEENQFLKNEVNMLRMQNSQMKNELYRPNNNILSTHQHNMYPNFFNQVNQGGFLGAGEQLASAGNLPSSGPSSINHPLYRDYTTEEDEKKNFRIQNANKLDDSEDSRNSTDSAPIDLENPRTDDGYTVGEEQADASFVQLKDDGYDTTQSNQTLVQTTPVKPMSSQRLAKNRETL
uniref:Uncharacterized protein n=1 Tax=Panagrolaimus sp. JU765 TaxID=591449 RepID=A0AC34QJU5_9BILA